MAEEVLLAMVMAWKWSCDARSNNADASNARSQKDKMLQADITLEPGGREKVSHCGDREEIRKVDAMMIASRSTVCRCRLSGFEVLRHFFFPRL